MKPLLACTALAAFAAAAYAEVVVDPTRPPAGWNAPAASASASAPARAASAAESRAPRVQSVQLPRDGRACALVDNRLVFVGDKLRGATVAAIDAQGVELRHPQGRSERLFLIDPAIVKQAAAESRTSPAPVASLGRGGRTP